MDVPIGEFLKLIDLPVAFGIALVSVAIGRALPDRWNKADELIPLCFGIVAGGLAEWVSPQFDIYMWYRRMLIYGGGAYLLTMIWYKWITKQIVPADAGDALPPQPRQPGG